MKCLGFLFFVPVNVTSSKVGKWLFPDAAATRNTVIIIVPLENIFQQADARFDDRLNVFPTT